MSRETIQKHRKQRDTGQPTNRRFNFIIYKTNKEYYELSTTLTWTWTCVRMRRKKIDEKFYKKREREDLIVFFSFYEVLRTTLIKKVAKIVKVVKVYIKKKILINF